MDVPEIGVHGPLSDLADIDGILLRVNGRRYRIWTAALTDLVGWGYVWSRTGVPFFGQRHFRDVSDVVARSKQPTPEYFFCAIWQMRDEAECAV
jgi:hypothetical protein